MNPDPVRTNRRGEARLALAYLTCLPVGARPLPDLPLAAAAWAFPLVGGLVGLLAALAGWLAAGLALPPLLIALAVLAVLVIASGALHEDGLADFADGLAGADPEHRRMIMRDSRIGTYGVLALVLVTLGRAGALATLSGVGSLTLTTGIVAAAAASRGWLPALMHLHAPAPGPGAGRDAGGAGPRMALVAGGFGLLVSLLVAGFPGLLAALLGLAAVLALEQLAQRRLGGYTGDVLGTTQQIAELVILVTLAASAA
jgi:adenosylcobinamide-GDP ribazoletransferase